jgi:hypothetical protein
MIARHHGILRDERAVEDARTLRARADHYRCLLWDVTDANLARSLQKLIATYEERAAKLPRSENATISTAVALPVPQHLS